ncbi:MAG: MarR family transcriptional regulator [Proteobacteria bacterium]|jgi:DNA-binding IclR family transcriptional regulator|nr:MarR family transcriptional regulator [Pseudomonadota bacterium]
MSKSATSQSAGKVLDVLNVLLGHFASGLTPTELAKATKHDPANITRYVGTLVEKGFAERIPETGRIRPSHRLAQHAVSIMRSLDEAQRRIEESRSRITSHL